jgi:hypothetical protein
MIAYVIGQSVENAGSAREPVQDSQNLGFREVVAVWAAFALVLLATFVTYAWVPPSELYNVSAGGLEGGLGRALVETNYPWALVAIAVLAFAADRLGPLALLPVPLCAVLPWVVDQDDLDARPANAIPAAGVALALVLTVAAIRSGGLGVRGSARGDGVRLALAVLLAVISIPWMFAELGFYPPWPFQGEEIFVEADGERLAAVHLGSHHGTDGALLALSALLLSRQLPRFRRRRLAQATGVYLGIMLAYGCANAAQDFWHEQVVKRGWTDAGLPSMILPELSLAWAAILALGIGAYALFARSSSQLSHSDIGT